MNIIGNVIEYIYIKFMCCNGMFGYIYGFGFELYVKFIMDSSILKKGFIIFY